MRRSTRRRISSAGSLSPTPCPGRGRCLSRSRTARTSIPKFAAECLWRLAAARDGDGRPLLVPHNAIFELRCTARLFEKQLGMSLEEAYFEVRSDTMVEAYIEAAHESYALKSLTWETFGHKMTEIMELFGRRALSGKKLTKFQQDSIQFHLLDPDQTPRSSTTCARTRCGRWRTT